MTDQEWDERLQLCRAQLAPALVLVGEWEGSGQAHGAPVAASLRVRPILDGSVIEVWERVGDHEDLSLYRYDPEVGQLRVMHIMAGALVREWPVEPTMTGLVWITPPSDPAVEWSLDGDTLRCDVLWPGQRVAEVTVRYRRKAR